MSSNNNDKLENILDEALKHYEEGKSIPEILDLFPEHKKDLEGIFEAIELVRRGKDFIEPQKEFLSRIIERIQVKGVTYLKIRRYSYGGKPRRNLFEILRGRAKGRTSFIRNLINQIRNSMTINWKVAVPIVVIVAAIAVSLITQFKWNVSEYSREGQPDLAKEQERELRPLPVATGNVDDAIDAVLSISLNEGYTFDAEVGDLELIDIDDSEISEFGQSYGEDEF